MAISLQCQTYCSCKKTDMCSSQNRPHSVSHC